MRSRRIIILSALCLSAASGMVMASSWYRMLTFLMGNTTYSASTIFGTMFLALALGASLSNVLQRRATGSFGLGIVQSVIGIGGLLSIPMIYALNAAYLKIYTHFHLYPAVYYPLEMLLVAVVTALPLLSMGIFLLAGSEAILREGGIPGRTVGLIVSAAAAGLLLSGLFLIPSLGMKSSVLVGALMNLIAGGCLLLISRKKGFVALAVIIIPAALSLNLAQGSSEETTFLTFYSAYEGLSGRSYSSYKDPLGSGYNIVFEEENTYGNLKLFVNRFSQLFYQLGGRMEGSLSDEVPFQRLMAYLPMSLHPEPESILHLGLGTGVTVEASLKGTASQVEAVEPNPALRKAVMEHVSSGAFEGLTIHEERPVPYLMRTDKKYDIIISSSSYPSDAASSIFYTIEFYRLASSHLSSEGVFAQRVPYHALTPKDMTIALKTLYSVFPNIYVWKDPLNSDLITLGSRVPFSFTEQETRERVRLLNKEYHPIYYTLSKTPEEVTDIVGNFDLPINTVDHPVLEFRTVMNLLLGRITQGR